MKTSLSSEQFEAIRRLDTCAVANAIELLELRLRNEGFANSTVRCMFPRLKPMIGYAVTAKGRRAGSRPGSKNCPARAQVACPLPIQGFFSGKLASGAQGDKLMGRPSSSAS